MLQFVFSPHSFHEMACSAEATTLLRLGGADVDHSEDRRRRERRRVHLARLTRLRSSGAERVGPLRSPWAIGLAHLAVELHVVRHAQGHAGGLAAENDLADGRHLADPGVEVGAGDDPHVVGAAGEELGG